MAALAQFLLQKGTEIGIVVNKQNPCMGVLRGTFPLYEQALSSHNSSILGRTQPMAGQTGSSAIEILLVEDGIDDAQLTMDVLGEVRCPQPSPLGRRR